MAALASGEGGRLRVGTFQSVGARVLPAVMRRFTAAWPHVAIELNESPSDEELVRLVERGELDLAFAMPPLLDGPFEALELLADPYVLLVPAEHDLASLTRASLADVGDLTLIGNRACRSTALAEGELAQRGVGLDVAFRSDDNGTVQGLVGAGFGVALVPLLATDPRDERVRVLELDPEIPPRRIALVWHRDRHRSPARVRSWRWPPRSARTSPRRSRLPSPDDRLPRRLVLLLAEADVGVAPERAREDPYLLRRDRAVEVVQRGQRADAERPAPALPFQVLLRLRRHLDDGERGLPDARVADRQIALRT